MKIRISAVAAVVFTAALALAACAKPEASAPARPANALSVAVFVPGVASGSPIYEQLVSGAERAAAQLSGAKVKVIEGGFDQSAWLDKLRDIAASGEFGLIVSSNPALPELAAKVAADFPAQRFFIADAYLSGHASIHTVLYNQLEQGYVAGYLAGLVTKDRRPAGAPVAGLVAAQRYPTLDRLIQPGFEAGLKAVDPAFRLEYREVGNWYDANRAAELARSLYNAGVEVILPIAGGAGQGVVASAAELGKAVLWFDGSGYELGPKAVVGCATLDQDRLVYERVKALLEGGELYGKAEVVGTAGGYIGFDPDGEAYRSLPEALRERFEAALAKLAAGEPAFTIDSF